MSAYSKLADIAPAVGVNGKRTRTIAPTNVVAIARANIVRGVSRRITKHCSQTSATTSAFTAMALQQ